MIGKLLLFLMVAAAIQAQHQEDVYNGPFLPNGCPTDIHVHWLLRHPDCSKFYQCNFGERVERDCAPGTLFNYNANPGPVCDWPRNVDCDGDGTTRPPPGPDPCPEPPTCPPPEECVDPTPPPPPPPPPPCECSDPWPHETDCDKFWRCENGDTVLVSCSEGLHFNKETGTCDYICNANCESASLHAKSDWDGLKIYIPWDQVESKLRASKLARA